MDAFWKDRNFIFDRIFFRVNFWEILTQTKLTGVLYGLLLHCPNFQENILFLDKKPPLFGYFCVKRNSVRGIPKFRFWIISNQFEKRLRFRSIQIG